MRKILILLSLIAFCSFSRGIAQRLLPDAEKKFNKVERYELGENGEEISDGEMFTTTKLNLWYNEERDETLVVFTVSAMSGAVHSLLHYVEELKNRAGHKILALHMSGVSDTKTQYAVIEYQGDEIVSYTRIVDGKFYRHTKVN